MASADVDWAGAADAQENALKQLDGLRVGGNAGFGVGFSFISAMEIMYWLTIRLVQNYYAVGGKKENKYNVLQRVPPYSFDKPLYRKEEK